MSDDKCVVCGGMDMLYRGMNVEEYGRQNVVICSFCLAKRKPNLQDNQSNLNTDKTEMLK